MPERLDAVAAVDPGGFEFGGRNPAPQTAFLRNQIQPLIASHRGDIYFVDLHTGLGPSNSLTLISGADWPKGRVEVLRSGLAMLLTGTYVAPD